MLKFPSKVLSPSLEQFLGETKRSPNPVLSMPIRLDHGGGFGSDIHATQVLASWAAAVSESKKTLRIPPAFGESEHSRERFSSTLPGMAALYFSDAVESGVLKLDRYHALKLVAPRVAAMKTESFGDTIRGQGVTLCCFAGAKSEFLPALYEHSRLGSVRSGSDFRVLISRLLSQLGPRIARSVNEGQLDHLGALIYQLFLNADEHGSYDVNGNRSEPAMRGIAIRHTVVSEQGLAGADGPFQYYLNRLLVHEPTKAVQRLVEISVFDTGPGMSLRWLGERDGVKSYAEISAGDELDAVSTCFRKHMTTKGGKFYGEGLSTALTAMKHLGAFMTLRTGRLSLYQDLMHRNSSEFMPTNRFPGQALEPISGTGYTICFMVR